MITVANSSLVVTIFRSLMKLNSSLWEPTKVRIRLSRPDANVNMSLSTVEAHCSPRKSSAGWRVYIVYSICEHTPWDIDRFASHVLPRCISTHIYEYGQGLAMVYIRIVSYSGFSQSSSTDRTRDNVGGRIAITSAAFGTRIGPTHIQNRSTTIVSRARERGDCR